MLFAVNIPIVNHSPMIFYVRIRTASSRIVNCFNDCGSIILSVNIIPNTFPCYFVVRHAVSKIDYLFARKKKKEIKVFIKLLFFYTNTTTTTAKKFAKQQWIFWNSWNWLAHTFVPNVAPKKWFSDWKKNNNCININDCPSHYNIHSAQPTMHRQNNDFWLISIYLLLIIRENLIEFRTKGKYPRHLYTMTSIYYDITMLAKEPH